VRRTQLGSVHRRDDGSWSEAAAAA
jgi:hypothetical protein